MSGHTHAGGRTSSADHGTRTRGPDVSLTSDGRPAAAEAPGSSAPGGGDPANRAIVLTGPHRLSVEPVAMPRLRSGHVIVRTAYVGLCGSDATLFDGSSVYLHEGLKQYPFVFGHEWSGSVHSVATDVADFAVGQRVVGHNFITCDTCAACRSGHRNRCRNRSEMGILGPYPGAASEYFVVPAKVLAKLPGELSSKTGALLEPGSTALHAMDRVGVRDDDVVAVFGTGALGLISIQLAKYFGATVHAVGIDPAGLELALALGADAVLSPDDAAHDTYTAVVECSGAPRAISQAASCLTAGGRLALVGIAHEPVDGFPAAQLVMKDATVRAVLSGIDQWDRLIGLAARGAVHLDPLLHAVVPYSEADRAFAMLLTPNRRRPKILLEFAGEDRW
jgi:2-desacetyl-2-hydroxyethyl bacteriochlorophyllide A dehydrogenase